MPHKPELNSPASTFPPLPQRRCVAIGWAEVVERKSGGPVMGYYWGRIAEAWAVWPGTNLVEFCRAYHIVYAVAVKQPEMSLKTKAMRSMDIARTRVELVLSEIRVELVRDARSEARQIAKILDSIQQIGGLGVTFAMARLAKFTDDGGLMPVTSLPSTEVKRCVEIALKATEILRNALELRQMSQDQTATHASRAEPRIKEVATQRPLPNPMGPQR